jgi:hypothetical protein
MHIEHNPSVCQFLLNTKSPQMTLQLQQTFCILSILFLNSDFLAIVTSTITVTARRLPDEPKDAKSAAQLLDACPHSQFITISQEFRSVDGDIPASLAVNALADMDVDVPDGAVEVDEQQRVQAPRGVAEALGQPVLHQAVLPARLLELDVPLDDDVADLVQTLLHGLDLPRVRGEPRVVTVLQVPGEVGEHVQHLLPLPGRRRRRPRGLLERRWAHPGRRRGGRRRVARGRQEARARRRDLLGHLRRRGRAVEGGHVGLQVPEHLLQCAAPDVVLRHLRADREPHGLPPLRGHAEHVADPRQRAQRRRPQLRPRPSAARGCGRGDELARERVEVRRPGGCVRVGEEGASRRGDRPGVAQEPGVGGAEPASRLRAALPLVVVGQGRAGHEVDAAAAARREHVDRGGVGTQQRFQIGAAFHRTGRVQRRTLPYAGSGALELVAFTWLRVGLASFSDTRFAS